LYKCALRNIGEDTFSPKKAVGASAYGYQHLVRNPRSYRCAPTAPWYQLLDYVLFGLRQSGTWPFFVV